MVTDDAQALKERLEAVTGERAQPEREREHGKDGKASPSLERPSPEASTPSPPQREIEPAASKERAPEPEPAREKCIEIDVGL